jgi:hypothetical protein
MAGQEQSYPRAFGYGCSIFSTSRSFTCLYYNIRASVGPEPGPSDSSTSDSSSKSLPFSSLLRCIRFRSLIFLCQFFIPQFQRYRRRHG